MFGWHGRVLRVDLAGQTISVEQIDPEVARDYIGGRGWAIKVLHDEVEPTVDPLSPENKLIFTTGPLTGTPAPTGNRYMVTTKAPLTGAIACSNSGGMYPTEMKRTGFDMIILEGRAEQPVYLWIDARDAEEEPRVELRSASHLWGKPVPETTDTLLAETDERARVACIGPAGERLVKMASIMNDKRRGHGQQEPEGGRAPGDAGCATGRVRRDEGAVSAGTARGRRRCEKRLHAAGVRHCVRTDRDE